MEKKKVGFASGLGFILAASGSAIGLGNLWAFPAKVATNGGAAFVLVYIACVLLIGYVTMMAEMFIGKRAHANPVTAYKTVNKNIGWFGLVAIAIPTIITCYYAVLGGWTVKFAANSFGSNVDILNTFSVNTVEVVLFIAVFVAISVAIIMLGVQKGIENMSKILMPVLFLIIVGVAIYSCCLGEGAVEGLKFYLVPDFSKLTVKAVLTAMGQAFYSLSLGMGIMITYGSYTGKEINIAKSCGMICIFDTVIALLAGLAIFPAVAHFDPELLEKSSGLTLMYDILPKVFDSMGVVGKIVSFLFFTMVTIAAVTSVISLIEVATQFVIQKFKMNRKIAAFVVAIICLAAAIPIDLSLGNALNGSDKLSVFGMDALTFFDEVTNTVLMPVCALFACIVVGWIIKPKNAIEELENDGTKFPAFLRKIYPVMIKFVTPLLILAIEVSGVYNTLFKKNDIGQTVLNKSGLPIVIAAYGLIVLCLAVYFIFFARSYTGTNEDEK